MTEISIANARNRLTRLIHEAESGQPVHITRRGKPVAVLVSEKEYALLRRQREGRDFWELIEDMRADPGFVPIDVTPDELDAWRDRSAGRGFEWSE